MNITIRFVFNFVIKKTAKSWTQNVFTSEAASKRIMKIISLRFCLLSTNQNMKWHQTS